MQMLLAATAFLLAGGGLALAGGGPGSGTDAGRPVQATVTDVAVAPRDSGGARPSRDRPLDTADPAARPPAPPGAPPPLEDFGAVTVHRPAVRLDAVAADNPLGAVLEHPDVRFATVVHTTTMAVAGADGQLHEVTVAAVDPRGFRVLTPQVTADAHDLWQHLVDGNAVVSTEAAERVGAGLGGVLDLVDRPEVRVGAIAVLGVPSPADVIVSRDAGFHRGIGESPSLLVSISDAARASRVAAELAERVAAHATPLVEDRVVELGRTHVPADQWDGVWDRLAQCESSGRWHLDSGNGYYGGLQFLPSSWHWVGGTGLPHEASREEQIARAKILLAHQGWEAWPACSAALGYR
ncbi:MAG: transglycosylase family protein [Egibacteraceae bacterium]